jgi:hypothetical protein
MVCMKAVRSGWSVLVGFFPVVYMLAKLLNIVFCWDNVKMPSLLSAHGLYEGSTV